MIRLEVRCCCQPRRLLGWVEVPDPNAPRVRLLRLNPLITAGPLTTELSQVIELPIETMDAPGRRPWRAVKAEGLRVEDLRTVFGFTEAR